jgi:ABC-type bacteriocin/lantibiotic exporter with double-glycine peptidase domain
VSSRALRILWQLLVAVVSLCALLAVYFFWLLVPLGGILLYAIAQYAFIRRGRRRKQTLRAIRLAHEAEARAYDLRRGRAQ